VVRGLLADRAAGGIGGGVRDVRGQRGPAPRLARSTASNQIPVVTGGTPSIQ